MKQKMINKVQQWNDTSTCTSQPYEKQTQTTFLAEKEQLQLTGRS